MVLIYIRKRRTPRTVQKRADEIKNANENRYRELQVPRDTELLRQLFNQMPKNEVRIALVKEQHGLCAYCMGRITGRHDDTIIEHYKALNTFKDGALDYKNYLGVCSGGKKEKANENGDDNGYCLCCDVSKGSLPLTIDPWNERQMEVIGYYKSGEIYARHNCGLDNELIDKMQYDIDNVLHLNGEKDADGRIKYDTYTKLVAKRRSICDAVHSQFERWSERKILTADFLQEKIDRLENMLKDNNMADEYIGVWLYLYKRKLEKLRRKENENH